MTAPISLYLCAAFVLALLIAAICREPIKDWIDAHFGDDDGLDIDMFQLMNSSPRRTLSWTAPTRIFIARSLMRFARSFALWIAPELRGDA